jgi:hypothetical protein
MNKYKTQNPKIVLERTSRGFLYGAFKDTYGNNCSIQKSSRVASGPGDECIWLGVDTENSVKIFPRTPEATFLHGSGWQEKNLNEYFIGCDVVIHDRMHLTQKMVEQLLPTLQHFAKTGELPEPKE